MLFDMFSRHPITPNDPIAVYVTFVLGVSSFLIALVRFIKYLRTSKKNEKSRSKLFCQSIIFLVLGMSFFIVCWVILKQNMPVVPLVK